MGMSLAEVLPESEMPFIAANAQNALAAGSLSNHLTAPIQQPHGMANQSLNVSLAASGSMGQMGNSSFGNMGQTMGQQHPNAPMSPSMDMGNHMQMQQGGMQQQMQQMQMQQMQMQQQMSGPGLNQMLSAMSKANNQMTHMQEKMAEQRNYIEQRDAWLETRMSQLDRRAQKVEVLSDRLFTDLSRLNVDELASVPRTVKKTLHSVSDGMMTNRSFTTNASMALRDTGFADAPVPDFSNDISQLQQLARPATEGGAAQNNAKLEQQLNDLAMELEALVSNAEATPQITRLLWRMDVNLKQLSGTGVQPGVSQVPVASKEAAGGRHKSKRDLSIGGASGRNSRAASKVQVAPNNIP